GANQLAGLLLFNWQSSSLFEQHCRRRSLDDELERPVRVYRDDHRQHHPFAVLRLVVELLDEGADIYAMGAQGWPNRRRGRSLAARTLQPHLRRQLLRHILTLLLTPSAGQSS